ncbi:MAG: imidazole glycerol phosphate synthase subunit HisH [Rickettsiales bacterium]
MPIRLRIVDYGSGNLHSMQKACERALRESGKTGDVALTSDAADISSATHIVLPGVGAFGDCLAGLKAAPGVTDALEKAVHVHKTPFLGVCVGMQLLARKGFEFGEREGLGWVDAEVRPLARNDDDALIVPHMGWNMVQGVGEASLWKEMELPSHAYFVHSYAMTLNDPSWMRATTEYGREFTSLIAKGNIWATQFHPEKSSDFGIRMLRLFCEKE